MIKLLLKLRIIVLYDHAIVKPQNTCTRHLFQFSEILIILTLYFCKTHVHIELYNLLYLTYMVFCVF